MKYQLPITRRTFLRIATATTGIGLATGLYTWRLEPHWVELVERPLPLKNLPKQLVGTRLIHLSDIHIGPRVEDQYLRTVFDNIRQLAPDIVVYTGDFTSYHTDILAHADDMFPHLPLGTQATFGILGNHDYGPNWAHPEIADELAARAENAGVKILRNEIAEFNGLQVIGLDDLWAKQFKPEKPLSQHNPNAASLVLTHNPDTVDLPNWQNYTGWILAGHTHGGQCKAPFLPPPILPVKNRRYTAGEFTLDAQRNMYINRGIGHLLQVRFNVRPEITQFHLTQA